MIPIKFYIYGALIAVLAGAGFWFNSVLNERAELKTKLTAAELSRDTAIAGGIQYQENNERQVKLISGYQSQLEARQNANTNDERDSNAGIKRVYVKANCPATSSAPAIPTTTQAVTELDPIARGNYFRLKSGIITLEENYALCLQILNEDRKKAAN